MKKLILALSAALVLLMVLAVPASAVAVQNAQTWYLDSTEHSSGFGWVMEKEGSGAQSGSVDIGAGESVLWISNGTPANAEGVTFSGNNFWLIQLETGNWAASCQAVLGTMDGEGNFDDFDKLISYNCRYIGGAILEIQIQIKSEDAVVPQDSYLALMITNSSGMLQTVTTGGANSSYVSSPDSTPTFPVPEMSAGLLFGVGLAGVGTFIFIRRKQGRGSSAK
jgi:hypothetical protein